MRADKEVEDMLQRVYAAALYKTYFEKTSEGLNFEKTSTEIWFETMLQSDTKLSFCSDIVVVSGHDEQSNNSSAQVLKFPISSELVSPGLAKSVNKLFKNGKQTTQEQRKGGLTNSDASNASLKMPSIGVPNVSNTALLANLKAVFDQNSMDSIDLSDLNQSISS